MFSRTIISDKKIIFWDFDGVIKDSVGVKTEAFLSLFPTANPGVINKIRSHHESHGGMSRFEKIPIYISFSGEIPTPSRVLELSEQFSKLVMSGVIESPWVGDAEDFLLKYAKTFHFVLVTATPHLEIKIILKRLNIDHCFQEVYGSPNEKSSAIASVLSRTGVRPEFALMIGDSEVDLKAAAANNVPFLLRKTSHNVAIQSRVVDSYFDNLSI